MQIHGIQKLTLLDYPGHTACTVFTGHCNFRCPFCQNASLVLHPGTEPELDEEEIFAFLEKRKGLLDGVCITGGEPTLQWDLPAFVSRVKENGFAVKLDTNGSDPKMLRAMLEAGLLDYVAMDIKNSREKYALTAGKPGMDVSAVEESAALLMEGSVDFEFRTTVVKEFHTAEDFAAVGAWLRGGERYFLQGFQDSGDLIEPGLHACSRKEMEDFRAVLLPCLPRTELRGVD